MRKMIKWPVAVIIFVMCCVGLEIYRNTEIMHKGYLLQKLKAKKEIVEEENDYLHQKLSSYFSLGRVEQYAREKLSLVKPEELRFLKERLSPPIRSSSPSPSPLEESKSWFEQIADFLKVVKKTITSFFHAKDKEARS